MFGFFIVLLASVFFCFQNVIVRVLFNEYAVFGWLQTGGFVAPTMQNSFLLLVMRMVLIVPLMGVVAQQLYPPIWKEIRQLGQGDRRRSLLHALGGGGLMFLYLVLLYVSIGLIPTGIALTLFFTYPVFTALLSWRLFGSRPTLFRWSIMGLVVLGSALTMPYAESSSEANWSGIGLALASGLAYAFYSVNAQKSFETIHPVPFTWMSFSMTLVLSGLCLMIGLGSIGPGFLDSGETESLQWMPLWIGGLLSAIATCLGHLLYNSGIRLIGATSAAMIGASNPALTVLLAWFAIQERLNAIQLLGVLIVTLSVASLSREPRPSKA